MLMRISTKMKNKLNISMMDVTKFILVINAKLGCLDLYQSKAIVEFNLERRKKRKLIRRSKLSNISLAFQLFSISKLLVICIVQYAHDYQLHRIKKFGSQLSDRQVEDLEKRAETIRNVLHILGCPLIKFEYSAECLYIYIIAFWLLVFSGTIWYFTTQHPFDDGLVRAILNEKNERNNCNLMIANEIRKFYTSIQVFTFSRLSKCKTVRVAQCDLMQECRQSIASLRRIVESKNLFPVDRTRSWLHNFARVMAFGFIAMMINLAIISLVLYWRIPERYSTKLGFIDSIASVELFLIAVLLLGESVFLLVIVLAEGIDILLMSTRITNSNYERQVYNMERFRYIQSKSEVESMRKLNLSVDEQNYYADVNDDLIHFILQYKIFFQLVKPGLDYRGFFTFGVLEIIFLPLILFFIHWPLFSPDILPAQIPVAILSGSIGIIILFALCYINQRAQKFYKSFFRLTAFVIEVNNQSRFNQRLIYQHTTNLLLKEIADPHRLAKRFSPKAFGFELNYGSLLTIFFWAGMLALILMNLREGEQFNLLSVIY